MIVTTLCSLMLNGICCAYQMAEEEERRRYSEDSLKRTIQNELTIQKFIEEKQRQEELKIHTKVIRSQEERRWRLMTAKNEALSSTRSKSNSRSCSSSSHQRSDDGYVKPTKVNSIKIKDYVDDAENLQPMMVEMREHSNRDIRCIVDSRIDNGNGNDKASGTNAHGRKGSLALRDISVHTNLKEDEDVDHRPYCGKYFTMTDSSRPYYTNNHRMSHHRRRSFSFSSSTSSSNQPESPYGSLHHRDSTLSSMSSLLDAVFDEEQDSDSDDDGDNVDRIVDGSSTKDTFEEIKL